MATGTVKWFNQLAQSGQLSVNSAPRRFLTKILRSAAAPFIVLLPYRPVRIHAFYVEWAGSIQRYRSRGRRADALDRSSS